MTLEVADLQRDKNLTHSEGGSSHVSGLQVLRRPSSPTPRSVRDEAFRVAGQIRGLYLHTAMHFI